MFQVEKSLALKKDKTIMSEFFHFNNSPHDIKKLIVSLSQSDMLCQFPWEVLCEIPTVCNSENTYSVSAMAKCNGSRK